MTFGSSGTAEKWRHWLAEAQAPLSSAQMLTRVKVRLNAFCFGDEADEAKAPDWPLSPAQECAVAKAALALTGPERLRAVANLLEASPLFDWFSSVKSCVKAGVDPRHRYYRAFHRIDLADQTYCKPNVGVTGPSGRNCDGGLSFSGPIPGWSGRWPSALALDAKGWAAVLWGSPRNTWRWWPTWNLGFDEASMHLAEEMGAGGRERPGLHSGGVRLGRHGHVRRVARL